VKLIAFSLWGDHPLYLAGAVENARLAPEVYPGWTARFYCAPDVPAATIAELRAAGAEVAPVRDERGPWAGLFWRFLPIDDPRVERMISRDVDSRLNPRERACVDRWVASGRGFHVIRDHAQHDVPILGGTFGCVGGRVPLLSLLAGWGRFDRKGCDQEFLEARIWPLVRDDHLAHDERTGLSGPRAEPFPEHPPLVSGSFVGEPVGG